MPLLCHFTVLIKVTKILCIIQYLESNSRVIYFLLEVPNLKIHKDMTFYNF